MLNKKQVRKIKLETDWNGEKEINKGKYVYKHFIRRKISSKLYFDTHKI